MTGPRVVDLVPGGSPGSPASRPPKRDRAAEELDALSIGAALTREEDRLERGIEYVATGWPRVDAALGGGLAIPSLDVIGAGPKAGKSTWVQMVVERHVEAGGVAYVLDLENGRRRVLRQLLCRRAQLGPSDVARALANERAGVFTSREAAERWRLAKAWLRETLGPRLYVECAPPHDLLSRIAAARQVAGTHKLLVVIDSLQKLPPTNPRDDRRTTIDRWIRLLERIRYEHEPAIVVVSEIRRGREGYAPREDAYKESGGIEYAADLAMTLDRPAADEDTDVPATLRIELARDSDEDPRGDVASYRPVRPYYGLEEIDPVARRGSRRRGHAAEKADGARAWLDDLLANGPVQVARIIEQAQAAGYSRATVYRAKTVLKLEDCAVQLRKGWRLP